MCVLLNLPNGENFMKTDFSISNIKYYFRITIYEVYIKLLIVYRGQHREFTQALRILTES
jgi:hypothetical protein